MGGLGLYFHIPFCRSRCLYCDFTSTTGMESAIPAYCAALLCELRREWEMGTKESVDSIFFGGGTPSLLEARDLAGVLEYVQKLTDVAPGAEITLEANPGTLDLPKLARLREAGFNRLSLGVQSSHDQELGRIGRAHNRKEAETAFNLAQAAGFNNINMDLIFGLPGQTLKSWEETLDWATAVNPEHLSCYGLQVEEGTAMAEAVRRGHIVLPPEEETVAMMEWARRSLPNHGLAPYEISNYARPGRECRHNLRYWQAEDYLGIGAGATSTRGLSRWSNTDDLLDYIRGVEEEGVPRREYERLTEREKLVEAIMLGLRMTGGFNWTALWKRWGAAYRGVTEAILANLTAEGWLIQEGAMVRLSEKAIPVSNRVIGELCAPILD